MGIEDKIPLIQRIMEKTIGYDLEGFNVNTGRYIHSMRDGGAEFTDEEMEERQHKWKKMLMEATHSKSQEELKERIALYSKFLKEHNMAVGDGFFTNYKAWDKVNFD